jgi:catechol 2,3-dioxygenase-like lactoylglutathione lyase family enzyme
LDSRINIVTLGVKDVKLSRRFYENGLGFKVSSASQDDIVFFHMNGSVLALYPRTTLAEDAQVPSEGNGFRGVTFAQNVNDKSEVAKILEQAERAGARIVKPAQDVFWGGHSGYFADPDDHLWEIAWNPHFPMDKNGHVQLPE